MSREYPISIKIGELHGIYENSCINCGGETEDTRLLVGLPCRECLPDIPDKPDPKTIYNILLGMKRLKKRFIDIYVLNKRIRDFIDLFNKAINSRPWSAQVTWALRVFRGESFSIVAPTGVGKTLFGMMMSLYISGIWGKGKSYILVPTTALVEQIYNRLVDYSRRLGLDVRIRAYHGNLKRSERRRVLDDVSSGSFDILISTNQFLARRFDVLEANTFKFIFVDDVDAIIRRSRNIDRILMLLGLGKKDIERGIRIIKLKSSLSRMEEEERVEALEEIKRLNKRLDEVRSRLKGILIVSSATGRPRGLRVRLFRELLGFQVGYRSEQLRNIIDTYKVVEGDILKEVVDLVKRLGGGGLIYIPVDKGLETGYRLAEELRLAGIKADVFQSGRLDIFNKFVSGELDVLIGSAIYYGVMVRGIDLPHRVRYAVFMGVPRFKFSAEFEDPNPIQMMRTLSLLKMIPGIDDTNRIDRYIRFLNRIIKTASHIAIQRIIDVLRGEVEAETRTERNMLEILKYIKEKLSDEVVREGLKRLPNIKIIEDDKFYILIPDVMTYIQASGRTSRLYAGGITRGLSIVLVEYPELLDGLIQRMRWIIEDAEWKSIDEIDLDSVIVEIDRDRRRVLDVWSGRIKEEIEDPVKTVLMIVESPNKARTIANFFGKPTIRRRDGNIVYEVSIGNKILMITASGGHVYDLITYPRSYEEENNILYGVLIRDGKYIPIYNSIKRCLTCGYQFTSNSDTCPKCGSDKIMDKWDRVEFIRNIALEASEVYIATDPDVEGEKIGYDIASLIRPYAKSIKRLEFHEVTRKAIINALNNPKDFNIQYVEAQMVRRIEDRWIGFLLTGKLWSEFRDSIGDEYWYKWRKGEWSAGRVQTPVLGWIIKRWDDIQRSRRRFLVLTLPYNINIEIPYDEGLRADILEGRARIIVKGLEPRLEIVAPPPPYTTDTMIEDANKALGISADRVMKIAQDLFELGLITYHRTDSTRVSGTGMNIAREYLVQRYGGEGELLYHPRKWSEAGAHECIRPTRPIDLDTLRDLISQGDLIFPIPLKKQHYMLYNMIFNRFIASQMIPAKELRQRIVVEVDGREIYSDDRVIEIVEDGFLRHYGQVKIYPRVPGVAEVEVLKIDERERATIYGYTQGDIIRLMREKGIGRPSTYSKIIKTLLDRKYVFETKRLRWLAPTDKGRRVYSYLSSRYGDMVSEERTRILEDYMRRIEEGRLDYREALNELYREIERLIVGLPEIIHPDQVEE